MNYSFKFRNVALSAMLLTAISAPIVANADSAANASTVTNGTATLKEVKSSIAAFTMANPVELAKKYSPDTVSEWEQTLANYNKLLSQTSTSDGIAIMLAADVDIEQVKQSFENAKPGEIKELQPLKVEGSKRTSVEGVKADKLPYEKTTGTTNAVRADAVTYQLSGTTTGASAFFSAQNKLYDAVTAKDAAAIKTSLAELLKQYKEQIAELEAAQE